MTTIISHFDLSCVEFFMRFVDVRMLINEGISRVVPDELNGHIQFIFAADTVTCESRRYISSVMAK